MTEEQLSALLRIKRFEQPPQQYFDRLLQDVHRRQRAELLRRPLWKIAAERVQTFFSEHSMGHLSYAGALASVLVVGVVGIGLITSGGSADQAPQKIVVAKNAPLPVADGKLLDLNPQSRLVLDSPTLQASQPFYGSESQEPRYVIDTRPASYEPSPAFPF